MKTGWLAQLGEHRPYKARVTGSSPVPPTNFHDNRIYLKQWLYFNGWLAQLGEHRPYKARVTGSSPVPPTTIRYNSIYKLYAYFNGWLAQLGEHRPYKARVTGSSPVPPTNSFFILHTYYIPLKQTNYRTSLLLSFQCATIATWKAHYCYAMQPVSFKAIKVLIIDNQNVTKNYLKYSLENLGYDNIYHAPKAQTAFNLCKENKFDLVLCMFDLEQEKDGFQIYDELKLKKLIHLSTAFIFISAETNPALVHGIIELQPDDFLVKPFTLKEFGDRVNRALKRKLPLKTVYEQLEAGKLKDCLDTIRKLLSKPINTPLFPQLLKIKGNTLLELGHYRKALHFFSTVSELQQMSWVKLGIVKSHIGLKQFDEATQLLAKLVTSRATRLEALELLSKIDVEQQNYRQAQDHLKQAADLSPRNVSRQQELINLSRITHDYEQQFDSSKTLLRYARNSVHDSPELYLTAARSGIDYATRTFDEDVINSVMKHTGEYLTELKKQFPQSDKTEQIEIINARILHLKNESDRAKCLVQQFSNPNEDIESVEDSLDKAKALHELGFYQQSQHLFEKIEKHCQQQSSDDNSMAIYLSQEKKERKDITADPKDLNNTAVKYYKRKNYAQALKAFMQAFRIMPNNVSIALNLLQSICESHVSSILSAAYKQQVEQCLAVIERSKLDDEQVKRLERIKKNLADIEKNTAKA